MSGGELDLPRARETLTELGTLWPRPTYLILPRKIMLHLSTVNVTLDEATAHPSLLLSENRRQVNWQESHQDLLSSTQRFDSLPRVLGQLHISSGRSFWEVKVEDTPSWDLAICQNNVTRKGRGTVSPQNGFWAIR